MPRIKSRRNPGGTGGNCRPKLFLSQLFFKAKASVLEDALKSVWLKCLRVAVRPHTMNPRGWTVGRMPLSDDHTTRAMRSLLNSKEMEGRRRENSGKGRKSAEI